jgi:hypothetical protein
MGITSRAARDPHTDEAAEQAAARPLPSSVALITALQRSAGNAAVARVLARAPVTTIPPPAPETAAEPPGGGSIDLTPEEKISLQMETHSHIDQAMNAWGDACLLEREAIAARAKANAEFTALVIDILTGFGAPFVARFASGPMTEAMRALLPARASGPLTALAGNADFVKATFTGSGKIANWAIKANASQLFGDPDEKAYLATLSKAFHAGAQALTDSLDERTVEELLALWYAYSFPFTNIDVYRQAIQQLLDEFGHFVVGQGQGSAPIDEMPGVTVGHFAGSTRVYAADLFGKTRLILVTATSEQDAQGETVSDDRMFQGYVPERLEDAAKAETVRQFGAVTEIDSASIRGTIPAPEDAPPPAPPEFAP